MTISQASSIRDVRLLRNYFFQKLVILHNDFLLSFSIVQACYERNDLHGDNVMIRLQGAPSDLHAADARRVNITISECPPWLVSPIKQTQFVWFNLLFYADCYDV